MRSSCERASALERARAPGRCCAPCRPDHADVRRRLVVDPARAACRRSPAPPPRSPSGPPRARCRHARRGRRKRDVNARAVRRAEDHLADRRRLVVDVAELRLEPRRVERVGAHEPDLLLRREDELDARRAGGLSATMRRAPRASPPPPPCCRRRGSSRPRCGRRRPRRPARSARRWDRVEVRAEEDRRALRSSRGRGSRGCPHRRADDGPASSSSTSSPSSRS